MTQQALTFASSPFWPIAIGFFGLGTGYFIWGGQALFGYPKNGPEVDRTMGLWGFWMPGFCQFLTGVYLMVGLTWFNVFGNAAPLYMAGVAFTVYGIHWFAMAHRRYIGSSAAPDGWMAIAYLFVSVLGAYVFGRAGDVPVMIVFIGLTLIYLVEVPTQLTGWSAGGRLVPGCSDRNRRASSFLSFRFRHSFLSIVIPVLLGRNRDSVRPGDERFINLPNGVKGPLLRGPCHQASDRQYRGHACDRARSTNGGIGLSLPNRILYQICKKEKL